MSNYILTADGKLYHCDVSESELYHYGVPGMRWGKRKARPVSTGMQRKAATEKAQKGTPEYEAARKARRKKALIAGVAIAGTALAAYGTYKLSKMAKSKARNLGQIHAERMLDKAGITHTPDRNAALNKAWMADSNLTTKQALERIRYNRTGLGRSHYTPI